MILDQKRNDVIIEGGEETVDMHISHNMEEHIMRMLIKAYSDPIGSLIREAASNGIDSHRMAGIQEPVMCRLKKDSVGSWFFEMEDFGLGLDEHEFHKYIMGIGESNKRGLAGVIGGYGIGAKAPSSYTEVYYYVCRKDGVERKFMIYQGERKITSEKIYDIPTTKGNGVSINIPVQSGDVYDFGNKIKEQLCYFSGIYFDVDSSIGIRNDFTIYRDEEFQWSEMCNSREMHISMDDVYYPINWTALGMRAVEVPIALRFSLTDGLLPIPNRENLEYTKDVIKLIKDKMSRVAAILTQRYNATIKETSDYNKIFDYFGSSYRVYKIEGTNKTIEITRLSHLTNVKIISPTLSGYSEINLEKLWRMREFLFRDHTLKYIIDYDKITSKIKYEHFSLRDFENDRVYIIDGRPKKKYVDYLKSKGGKFKLVEKTGKMTLGKLVYNRYGDDYTHYIKLLELKQYPKEKWRAVIQELEKFRKQFLDRMIDINSIEIPEAYKEERAKENKEKKERRVLEKGEFTLGISHSLERAVQGKNCKFVREIHTGEQIKKIGSLIVYGTEKDVEGMDNLWKATCRMKLPKPQGKVVTRRVIPVLVTDREYLKLNKAQINSTITYEEFMKGKTAPFRKLVTALMLQKWMSKQKFIFDNKENIKELSLPLYEDLMTIEKYCDNISEYASSTLEKSILEYAEANKLWDLQIMVNYKRAEKLIPNFEFMQHLAKKSQYYNTISKETLEFAKEYLKLKKVRLNLECYTQPKLFEETEEND